MEKTSSLSIGIAEVSANVPVQIREKLNFHTSEIEPIIKDLREEKILLETIFLCTCNRSMLIFITNAFKWSEAVSTSSKLLGKWSGNTKIAKYIDLYKDKDALGKLVILGVGADSAMLGEDQILGQIRRFYDVALKHGSTGPVLNRIFQTLIFVARKVKLGHQFSKGAVSIPGLVIKKIKEHEEDGGDTRKILMIGWGEIFFTIYKILSSDNRNYEIVISNRSLDKIKINNAKLDIRDIKKESRYFDVIISMVSRMGHVIDKNTSLLDDKKYLIFDLGVPRNIDPDLSERDNINLINIDDLNKIAKSNLTKRQQIMGTLVNNQDLLLFQEKMMNFLSNYAKLASRDKKIESILLTEIEKINFDPKLNIQDKKKIINFVNKKIYKSVSMPPSSS